MYDHLESPALSLYVKTEIENPPEHMHVPPFAKTNRGHMRWPLRVKEREREKERYEDR